MFKTEMKTLLHTYKYSIGKQGKGKLKRMLETIKNL